MQQEGLVPQLAPWRALAFYVVFGWLWFASIEALAPHLISDAELLMLVLRGKNYVFIAVTGALAGWQVRGMMRAEAARVATMQELLHIVRHAPVGIARVAADTGRVQWANGRLSRMVGMSLEALSRQNFQEVVVPKDAAAAQRKLVQLMAGGVEHIQIQCEVRPVEGGSAFTALCTISVVNNPQGTPMLVHVLQDLSEVEAARQAMEHSEQQLRLALHGSGSGMWDWDVGQARYTFSDGMAGLLRYSGTDLPEEMRFKDRVHPDDRDSVLLAVSQTVEQGALLDVSARVRCFDETYRWFHARGMRHMDAQGRVVRFSGILTDQTSQRQEQDRLRLAATVVDHAMEGIVVTNARSDILSVNPAFTRLLGYSQQELLGQTPRAFKSGRHDAAFYQDMWKAVGETGYWRGEIWNRRKSGEIFPERMSLSAVRNSEGATTHYVCMFTDISDEKVQQQRLEFLAHKDPLTGLSNRSWFGQELEKTVQQARASGEQMAVLLLNLDRFKDVNDSYGHGVGDEVLKHIARQVQSALRPGDMIGRMAGDEIIVVARDLQSAADAVDIADRLIRGAAQPWHSPDGFAVVVGVSAGICMYPAHADSAASLLQCAHAAVHGAKAGKGQNSAWCFYNEEMTVAARERLALEAKLRHAVHHTQLQLFYQPQVDIATGRIVGAEALLRWHDPVEGFISPARFIPVAESSGVIGPLGEWVILEACRQAKAWQAQGLQVVSVAVNVSPHQFMLTDIAACTARALQETGVNPNVLELEITESALAQRPEEALLVLRRLRELGVRLAIDDFGTGYSSLAQLKRLPIQVLKIDQGFIRDIPHSKDDMAISRAIIAMGRSLDLQVLAEGVETADQLAFLRSNGCDFFQGYLCSKPLPADQFGALLARNAGPASLGGDGADPTRVLESITDSHTSRAV